MVPTWAGCGHPGWGCPRVLVCHPRAALPHSPESQRFRAPGTEAWVSWQQVLSPDLFFAIGSPHSVLRTWVLVGRTVSAQTLNCALHLEGAHGTCTKHCAHFHCQDSSLSERQDCSAHGLLDSEALGSNPFLTQSQRQDPGCFFTCETVISYLAMRL